MKEIKIETTIREYNLDELSEADQSLIHAADLATTRAYAPYSSFHVGAACVLASGQVVTGSNQENAAYPSGLCAERTTLFACGHQHPDEPVITLAIAARSEKYEVSNPVIPCGACLQVMSEQQRRQKSPLRILLYGQSGKVYECDDVGTLMPLLFKLK